LHDVGSQIVDAAFTTGAPQRGSDAGLGEPGGVRGRRCDGKDRAGFRFGKVGGGLAGESVQERRIVFAQHRSQFVASLGASPHRILLSARQNRYGLD
jgi:hypothetical protein